MTLTSPRPARANADDLQGRFRGVMSRLGPFESNPHLAVGVSGGADSTALAQLCHDWALARGGRVTALIVDHGLRAGSTGEARMTARRLAARGIPAAVLTWEGAKPGTGIQAAARDARYGLMRAWCRNAGMLHLVVGHHADDQMETHLMRRARGDGPGTAGMSAIMEFPEVRLLRPLLASRRHELADFLIARKITWVDDPSNLDDGFERVRMRRRLADEPELADAAAVSLDAAGEKRVHLERSVAEALAATLAVHPMGFAWLDRTVFTSLEGDIASSLMSRLVQCLGGAGYPPAGARVERLMGRLAASGGFSGASLGRCRFLAERDGRILICRDVRNLPMARDASPGRIADWDGRFTVALPTGLGKGAILSPLGVDGWRQLPKDVRRRSGLSLATARSLPALFRDGILSDHVLNHGNGGMKARFRPKNSLAFNGFCVA
ncbi:MAG: tRNA lysidine(34) synthetase TilS [Rhodospirillales bacterium]